MNIKQVFLVEDGDDGYWIENEEDRLQITIVWPDRQGMVTSQRELTLSLPQAMMDKLIEVAEEVRKYGRVSTRKPPQ